MVFLLKAPVIGSLCKAPHALEYSQPILLLPTGLMLCAEITAPQRAPTRGLEYPHRRSRAGLNAKAKLRPLYIVYNSYSRIRLGKIKAFRMFRLYAQRPIQ